MKVAEARAQFRTANVELEQKRRQRARQFAEKLDGMKFQLREVLKAMYEEAQALIRAGYYSEYGTPRDVMCTLARRWWEYDTANGCQLKWHEWLEAKGLPPPCKFIGALRGWPQWRW